MKLQEMKQTGKRGSRKKETYDLSDLGEVQFDVVDRFDMFENPHGVEELTENDEQHLKELYGVSIHTHLALMNNSLTYFSCVF